MDEQYWYNMTTIIGKQQLNRNFSCGATQSSLTISQNNCLDIPKTVHETFEALLFLNTYNNKMYTSSLLWKHSITWTTLQPNLHKQANQGAYQSYSFRTINQPTPAEYSTSQIWPYLMLQSRTVEKMLLDLHNAPQNLKTKITPYLLNTWKQLTTLGTVNSPKSVMASSH